MPQVTLNKGGTAEQTVNAASIKIPDLWHIAEWLSENNMEAQADKVRECWHLTHSLLVHAQQ